MSKWDKLLTRICSLSKDLRFDELRKVLESYGYEINAPRSGSSHYTFRKAGCQPITIPKHEPIKKIYVEMGEGCLSVNRPVDGIVPRYARVTMEAYDMEGRKIHVRGREELAICFQHELDHLNGILFTDHIDKKNPFKGKDEYRAI